MSLPELDEPLSTIPTHTIPTNPLYELDVPSRDSGPTAFSGEKHVTLIEPSDGPPEEKKRRVDVDDPLADPKEVIAQLKSDLMRVHNSLKMAANAHFKLSLREQEYAELKKQLQQVCAHTEPSTRHPSCKAEGGLGGNRALLGERVSD